ncbi:MAG: DUF86 domain-containing protein [Anaerolineae bacterium]
MQRDRQYVLDILEAARMIQGYIAAIDFVQFEEDSLRQDGVARRLEIMGEATKRLSVDFKDEHPEIPWRLMAGMRNILIHDYDKVDLSVVWETVTQSIPPLIAQLEPLYARLFPDET